MSDTDKKINMTEPKEAGLDIYSGVKDLAMQMGLSEEEAALKEKEYDKESRLKAEVKFDVKEELKSEILAELQEKEKDKKEEKEEEKEESPKVQSGIDEKTGEVSVDLLDMSEVAEPKGITEDTVKQIVKDTIPQTPVVVNINTNEKEEEPKKLGFFKKLKYRLTRVVGGFFAKLIDILITILLSVLATCVVVIGYYAIKYMKDYGFTISDANQVKLALGVGVDNLKIIFSTKIPEFINWLKAIAK